MTYLEENLLQNEILYYRWKVHNFYLYIMGLWIFLWIYLFFPLFTEWHILNGIIGGGIILFFIYKIIYIKKTEIVVTDKRVLYKTWVISRNIFELQLNKVESAILDQNIFQRMIWAGTLIISWTWWNNNSKIRKSYRYENSYLWTNWKK